MVTPAEVELEEEEVNGFGFADDSGKKAKKKANKKKQNTGGADTVAGTGKFGRRALKMMRIPKMSGVAEFLKTRSADPIARQLLENPQTELTRHSELTSLLPLTLLRSCSPLFEFDS